MNIKLDLREITGPLTKETPECVISEIAFYNRLEYKSEYLPLKEYLEKINHILQEKIYVSISLEDDFIGENFSLLINFVSSSHEKWTQENLQIAFRHLISYFINHSDPDSFDNKPKIPTGKFNFGHKTNHDPLKYNAVILYRICRYYKIDTHLETTIEQMAKAVKALSYGTKLIREQIIASIETLPPSKLISLYNSEYINPSVPSVSIQQSYVVPTIYPDLSKLEDCYNQLSNTSNLISRIIPNSHEEAIIIIAYRFNINISEASNPLNEFHFINNASFSGKTSVSYIPFSDSTFMKKFLTNPIFYNIKSTWTEKLSFIYDASTLREFVLAEGYAEQRADLRNSVTLLRESRRRNNIYHGKNPYCLEKITIVDHELIEDINPMLLFSFGILEIPSTLYYISVPELTAWFSNRKIFLDPTTLLVLEKEIITKLKKICYSFTGDNGTIGNEFNKLLKIIKDNENVELAMTEKAQELSCYLWSTTEEERNRCLSFFQTMIELGLYMRGWKVTEKHTTYPLKSSQTNYPLQYQDKVEEKTNLTCIQLFEIYESLSEKIRSNIRLLPLVKFNKNNIGINLFSETVYKTIYLEHTSKLLDVIVNLKNVENEVSCIRTNSNFILLSGLFYGKICNLETDISIDQIDSIF